jgi:pseudaminic acid cytidylyltransferase
MEMKCLAIITARGGSKRIPRKNIKPFLGAPIIKYSIDAALKSKCFDEVMVSTEDHEIAAIAKSFGAKVPFFRSKETAKDHSTLVDVIDEVIFEYKKRGVSFKYFCCILPTVPFISSQLLKKSFLMLDKSKSDSLIPITKFNVPIQQGIRIINNNIKLLNEKSWKTRSQDYEQIYYDCGMFYWMKVNSFLKQKDLFATDCVPFVISELQIQDIDTKEDWEMAQLKYKLLNKLI